MTFRKRNRRAPSAGWVYRHYSFEDYPEPPQWHRKIRRLILTTLRLLPSHTWDAIRRGQPRLWFSPPPCFGDNDRSEIKGRDGLYRISIGHIYYQYFDPKSDYIIRRHSAMLLHEIGHAVCGHDCLVRPGQITSDDYLQMQIEADHKLIEWGHGIALVEWLAEAVKMDQQMLRRQLPPDLRKIRIQVGKEAFRRAQHEARWQLEHNKPRLKAARRAMSAGMQHRAIPRAPANTAH